ncbi:MAG: tetratricopeptide repeat protein [Spirochaetales bacterium]|nr:tetratricopeptide repeat protein [Spirochaetales bacterium]
MLCIFLPVSGTGFIDNRGNAYSKKGEYEKAIIDYNKAIGLDPDNSKCYCNRGLSYAYKREYENAITDFTKAIELNPKYASAYNNRGLIYFYKSDYDRAMSDYEKCLSLDPNYIFAYYNRGIILEKKDEYDEAIQDYTIVLDLDPMYIDAYKRRGEIYATKIKYAKAMNDYHKVIQLDPNDIYSYFKLIYYSCKVSNKQYNNSIKILRDNINKMKSWRLNIAYYFIGDIDINELLRIAGDDNEKLCEAYAYIGITYLAKDDKKNAKDYFQKCINTGLTNFIEYDIAETEMKNK